LCGENQEVDNAKDDKRCTHRRFFVRWRHREHVHFFVADGNDGRDKISETSSGRDASGNPAESVEDFFAEYLENGKSDAGGAKKGKQNRSKAIAQIFAFFFFVFFETFAVAAVILFVFADAFSYVVAFCEIVNRRVDAVDHEEETYARRDQADYVTNKFFIHLTPSL